jgi:hypothetical protein
MKQSNIPLPPQIIDCSTQTQNPQSGFKTVSTQFSNTLISNLFPCLQRTMLQTDDHKTSPYTFTKTTLEEKMSPVFNTTSARKHIVCSYIYIYIYKNKSSAACELQNYCMSVRSSSSITSHFCFSFFYR